MCRSVDNQCENHSLEQTRIADNYLSFLMFSAILAVAGVILSIFLICVIVTVIKKVSTPSTIDVWYVMEK